MKKVLMAFGCVIALVVFAAAFDFLVFAVWVGWSMTLPQPWDTLLSPLGAIGLAVLLWGFYVFYSMFADDAAKQPPG